MSQILTNKNTKKQLNAFKARFSHAVLLAGSPGSGKSAHARRLAADALDLAPDSLDTYGYFHTVNPVDGKSIGIDTVRELNHFLSLKVPVDKPINRVVIVNDSHTMTIEAQNSLLKNLEEPPTGTLFILTADSVSSLLPTISSRVQQIQITKPGETETIDHFSKQGFSDADIAKAYGISGGLPGLIDALLNDTQHPLKEAADKARQILSQTAFERLLAVDELSKQRDLAIGVTQILKQMATFSLKTAQGKTAERWQGILQASYEASEALSTNAQPKLALDKLMLSL